jgi:citrate lyase subunit beta/citryl-CoA lyase
MIEKARSLPADVLVLDLEDSVPPAQKEQARTLVRGSLRGLALRGQKVFVRVNSLSTGLIQPDLEAVVGQGLDGISLPKVESAVDVHQADTLIAALEEEHGLEVGRIMLVPWIETAKAILKAEEIAGSSRRLVGVFFGADDFTRDMGIQRSREGGELFYARSVIAVAARAAGVLALDTAFPDFSDEEGLIREAEQAKRLGYKGKFVIHPRQIEVVNNIFRPSAEEIAHARRVVEAFEAAVGQGHAATSLDGEMVDTAIAQKAKELLSLAEAIARKESSVG